MRACRLAVFFYCKSYIVISKRTITIVTERLIEYTEKDLGFLRIGSLNVRVKRTTEAFSQFLGVATSSTASNNNEKIHKSWGSADNVQVLFS